MAEIMGQVTVSKVIKVVCDMCDKRIYYGDPKAIFSYENNDVDYDDHPNKDFCDGCYKEVIKYIEVLKKLNSRINK